MENKKLTYEIPRNVKGGGLFLRLSWKGWACFSAISFPLSGITFFLFKATFTSFIVIGFIVLITYFTFEIDEKTGYSNYQNVLLAFNKSLVNKRLTPNWGVNENEKTKKAVSINIKTKEKNN